MKYLFAIIILIISIPCYGQRSKLDEGGDEILCDKCKTTIMTMGDDVKLGTIAIGSSGQDLPTPDGENNTIDFYLQGDYRYKYNISANITEQVEAAPGYATIEDYEWQVQSKQQNDKIKNRSISYTNVELKKQSNSDPCKSYARVKITLNKMAITPNAAPGKYSFRVTIQFTASGI